MFKSEVLFLSEKRYSFTGWRNTHHGEDDIFFKSSTMRNDEDGYENENPEYYINDKIFPKKNFMFNLDGLILACGGRGHNGQVSHPHQKYQVH